LRRRAETPEAAPGCSQTRTRTPGDDRRRRQFAARDPA